MTAPKLDRLLITGIPGTGKTCYGNEFASKFGFAHCDLEDPQTLNRLAANPYQFIADLAAQEKVVVTWGFNPADQVSLEIVRQFRNTGFKMIWLDGNRPAALQAFRRRGTVSEQALVAQMQRIERCKVVEQLNPTVINSFDEAGNFKEASQLLEEIRNG